jgi:amino acid transporter
LQKGAERSAKILIITIIMLLLAAWLESYVTHLSGNYFDKEVNQVELPVWASFLILAASFSFVAWYFIFYPIKVEKKLRRTATNA